MVARFFIACSSFTWLVAISSYGQQLPSEYSTLKTDKDRMLFLEHAIRDSLDEGQLTPVLSWSRLGLNLAMKNDVDTLKGIFLFDIGKAFTYGVSNFDSAIINYKQVAGYFPDKMKTYNVNSVREIMDRYSDLGNKDSSFVYMNKLLALIDTMPHTSPRRISLSQNIATVYQYFGMYKTAIHYFQIAINGNRSNGNYPGLGLALANLGVLYNEIGDDEKAITYSREALRYLAKVNMPYMQTASNLAEYHLNFLRFDSTQYYLNLSNRVAEKIKSAQGIRMNQNLLATIYIKQKKYPEAQRILENNYRQFSSEDNPWEVCRTLLRYIELDTATHNYDYATKHLRQVIRLSRENQFPLFTMIATEGLSIVFSKTGDFRSAWQHHVDFMKLKDSVSSEQSRADLNDLEVQYKTLQKEQQIQLLKSENEINRLALQDSRRTLIFYLTAAALIIVLLGVFFYQRNLRNQIQTQKLKAELQTQILRSQMNPHFIFNCLNSIENFIMKNDKRSASDYLNKFSLLIRTILDSSRNDVVPIARDMEALSIYIELEQLRFNNKFNCKTYLDQALTGGDYQVPSLLVQPYIENAIVHGLAHSEEADLNLTVTASLEGDSIKYVVQDNGIGREKAKEYNQRNKPNHKSVGLKISEDRIRIFNSILVENPVKITDLFDKDNEPAGTKVEIIIQAF